MNTVNATTNGRRPGLATALSHPAYSVVAGMFDCDDKGLYHGNTELLSLARLTADGYTVITF